MKKTYQMNDLDCANCAAKMEDAIRKIGGVEAASISFMRQKMTLELDEAKEAEIMEQVVKACKRIEPDCTVVL